MLQAPALDGTDAAGTARPSRPSRPIRSSLLQIVFILVAPAIAGLGALASGLYQSEREQLSQSIFMSANALASALDRDLAGTIAAAQVLAESPLLASGDYAAFHREATRVLPLLQGYIAVLADDSGRQLVNTMLPYGASLPVASNGPIRAKVFETGRPMISDLFVGETTGQRSVVIYVPVVHNGSARYTLGIGVRPSHLAELLKQQPLPQDWAATIVNSSDAIVAHSRDSSRVGSVGPLRPSQVVSPKQLIEAKRLDGTPIYVGLQKSSVSRWTVAIAVPVAQFARQPNVVLLYGGIGMLGIVLAGLILAARESARIARAVQNLIPAALALGRGETPVIAPSDVLETEEVAHALDSAHQLLAQRTLERDKAAHSVAERSLADEMFRLAVEACPSGMVMTDSDGKIVMVNTEVEQLFGYTRDELVGQSVDLLVPDRLRMKHMCSRLSFTSAPECRPMGGGRDLYGCRKNGSEFPIEVGLNPIHTGDELMVLSVIVDISERKRTERLKDEFVSTVSHELRTPLTSISGSLGLLVRTRAGKLPDSAARLLTIAHANSQRLVRLINDILDIEKMESGQIVFNFGQVAISRRWSSSAIEDNRGFADELWRQCPAREPSTALDVNADPDRLAQVSPICCRMRSSSRRRARRSWSRSRARAKTVRISVRDHGPGIPVEFKRHMFEKFAQADATNAPQEGRHRPWPQHRQADRRTARRQGRLRRCGRRRHDLPCRSAALE